MSVMQQRRLVLLCALLLASACTFGGTDDTPEDSAASSSSVRSAVETANVTYTGTVRETGISVYQEGTHRLILNDGRFILLESNDVDLNGYVDEQAEVFGTVRPTVEEGSVIMRVERIALLNGELSSSLNSEAVSSEAMAVSSVGQSAAAASVAMSSVRAVSSAAQASVAASSVRSVTVPTGSVEAMAQADLAPDRWTQKYCSTHIGFCFPVHKNWWYQSFGTTTSNLWHVEIGNQAITSLGEGAIVVRLVAGALTGRSDGTVEVTGGKATGYRSWTDDRHLEVEGDARLEVVVRYLTAHIEATEEEGQ